MSALAVSDDESDDDDDVLPAAAPAVEWVQCEHASCGKWRRLPPDIKADTLPDSWTCSMNTWNKEQASCDAPQEAEHEAQEAAAGSGVVADAVARRPLLAAGVLNGAAALYKLRKLVFLVEAATARFSLPLALALGLLLLAVVVVASDDDDDEKPRRRRKARVS